jgi:Fe2+ or Zn2+ uptake regulation protein
MKTHYYTNDIIEICNGNHLTADEVFSLLKLKYSDIGISSVYRNLEELTEK